MRTFVIALACSGCSTVSSTAARRFEFSRLAMGVEARLVLYARTENAAIEAAEAAFRSIAALEDVMSDWRATSELAHVAAAAGRGPRAVSNELWDVLSRALDIAARTDGAFDPTIGPLTSLWRAARTTRSMPDHAEIERARSLVDFHLVERDEDHRTVALARSGMQLDLGAIGKGFACQRAIEVLAQHGIASALVEMGGDLVCSAAPPERSGWKIDLAVNAAESNGECLVVSHRAVSTSGDFEQWVVIDGVRYSHVVDPQTGLGLTTQARAIVVAPDGATSDALATALGVLGTARGLGLLERFPGCEASIEEKLAGVIERRSSPGFALIPRAARHVQ